MTKPGYGINLLQKNNNLHRYENYCRLLKTVTFQNEDVRATFFVSDRRLGRKNTKVHDSEILAPAISPRLDLIRLKVAINYSTKGRFHSYDISKFSQVESNPFKAESFVGRNFINRLSNITYI